MIFSCLKSQKFLTIAKKRLTHVIRKITSVIFGVMSLPHLAYIAGVPQDGAPPQSLELESNMAIDYQEGSMDNFITGLHFAHVCPMIWRLAWMCWEASCTGASAVSCDIRPGVMYIRTYITFLVFRTRQGSQQTITGRTLIMSTMNDTVHSMLFWKHHRSGPQKVQVLSSKSKSVMSGAIHSMYVCMYNT